MTCTSVPIVLMCHGFGDQSESAYSVKSFALHVRIRYWVLNEDLSLSKCTQDHASLNQVNCSMTERYSCKFAKFYCRAIALCWIEQQEETS